jgi:chromosome partitioning protein
MATVVAISNQKGGVGKTTSAVNLSAEFAAAGLEVLVIDLDPQCSASSGLGLEVVNDGPDLWDVFKGGTRLEEIIRSSSVERVAVVPSSRDLVGLEVELGRRAGRELILRSEVARISHRYDVIVLDCPPSSGLLTLNALGASNWVLIPLQAEYYALEGLSQLVDTIDFVRGTFNPTLSILGVFMTMYDGRTNLSAQVEEEARAVFGEVMFSVRVPRSIKLSECPSHGVPVREYDSGSAGAVAYARLAREVVGRLRLVAQPSEFKKAV